MSKAAEFKPWVIQSAEKKQFSPSTSVTNEPAESLFEQWKPEGFGSNEARPESFEVHPENLEQKVANEQLEDEVAHSEQPGEVFETVADSAEVDEVCESEDAVQAEQVEEEVDPKTFPVHTADEFLAHGEAEFLRGYNACKENESLEFGDRLQQLEELLDSLRAQQVDVANFYDPLCELLVSAIESILATQLVESKESVRSIVSTLLDELDRESDGETRVFLNPSDATLLSTNAVESRSSLKIISDPRLSRGSVRAAMGDSIVESLIEKRVEQVVNQILKGREGARTEAGTELLPAAEN